MIIVKRIIKILLGVLFLSISVFILRVQYTNIERDTLFNLYTNVNLPLFPIVGPLNFFLPVILLAESFYLRQEMPKKHAVWLIVQGSLSIIITFLTVWSIEFGIYISFDTVEKPTWAMPYVYGYLRSLYLFGFWSILLGSKFRQLKLVGWILEK